LAIAVVCALTAGGSTSQHVAEALWRSVAHGGDSDSTGSLTGNLLGARLGAEALPEAWRSQLELLDLLERLALDLRAAHLDAASLDRSAYPLG
jgi:ADP-ribosylglycohydrolase